MNVKNILKIIAKLLIVLFVLLVIYIVISSFTGSSNVKDVFDGIEKEEASLNEYIVYGTHLNLKGSIDIDNDNIKNMTLCLNTANGEDIKEIELKYNKIENKIEFYTSDLINGGIDLESLNINTYYLFVKAEYLDGKYKLYSMKNNTDYENVEYYTITKNNKNNKIDIRFSKYNEKEEIGYMYISVCKSKLPKEVYDVVIDPGHGGGDVGAEYGSYREADLALKCAKQVKKELEDLGLKVRITRDGTEGEEYNTRTVYNEDGRVNVTGASRAKYVFSIHLNSIEKPNSQSGVEIYAPTRMNLSFAKSIASNIVKYANTTYSDLDVNYRVDDGIYVRTFTEKGIEDSINEAKRKGYEPYHITENTPYLYMLRETGGIATGAYVDGRNGGYGRNMYCNSNVGLEAYLIEIGYINNKVDLNNILNNQEGYVQGIVTSIKEKLLGDAN